MHQRSEKKRYYELDVLRFFAAFSVVLFHYTFQGYTAGILSEEFSFISQFSRYGYLGVDLFFMISGFVILLSASGKPLFHFATGRAVRLYPTYWFACSLTFLTILVAQSPHYSADLKQYLTNMSMVHEAFQVPSIDGVYWSLFVELRFYALIGILLLLNQMKRIELFLIAWLFAGILSFNGYQHKVIEFFLFPEWSASFIAGSLFYIMQRSGFTLLRIALLITTLVMNLQFSIERQEDIAIFYGQEFNAGVLVSVIFLFYIVFLGVVRNCFGDFRFKWLVALGSITYPLYLIHQVIGYIIIEKLNSYMSPLTVLITVMIGMLAVSWGIARYMEPYLSLQLKTALQRLPALNMALRSSASLYGNLKNVTTKEKKAS